MFACHYIVFVIGLKLIASGKEKKYSIFYSVPKLLAEVVWPKISHCGLSKEIIMYPLLEDVSELYDKLEIQFVAKLTGSVKNELLLQPNCLRIKF